MDDFRQYINHWSNQLDKNNVEFKFLENRKYAIIDN